MLRPIRIRSWTDGCDLENACVQWTRMNPKNSIPSWTSTLPLRLHRTIPLSPPARSPHSLSSNVTPPPVAGARFMQKQPAPFPSRQWH